MGYCHYYYMAPEFNAKSFRKVVADFQKITHTLKRDGIALAGWDGSGAPVTTSTKITFNGRDEESCETFLLTQKYDDGDFGKTAVGPLQEHSFGIRNPANIVGKYFYGCKTRCLPYDTAVMACLIVAKHHLKGDIIVKSDGADEEWKDGRRLCQRVLGYGSDFRLGR